MYFKIVVFTSLISFRGLSQKTISFLDSFQRLPIENVQVFKGKLLVGLTNDKGQVTLTYNDYLFARCIGYGTSEFNSSSIDTVYLLPKINEFREVNVRIPSAQERYDKILYFSENLASSEKYRSVKGEYFEFIQIININTNDTITRLQKCGLSFNPFQSEKTRSNNFNIYDPIKLYHKNEYSNLDTTMLNNWALIVPTFNSILEYNLTNTENLKINFKNKKVDIDTNILFALENNQSSKSIFEINFSRDTLKSWKSSQTTLCLASSKNISICFESTSKQIDFDYFENSYSLKNCSLNGLIKMKINDQHYIIQVTKGFYYNPKSTEINEQKSENLERIFKNVQYTNVNPPLTLKEPLY